MNRIGYKLVAMTGFAVLLSVLLTGLFGYYSSRKIIVQDITKNRIPRLVNTKATLIKEATLNCIDISRTLAHDQVLQDWFKGNEKNEKLGAQVRRKLTFISKDLGFPIAFASNIKTKGFYTANKKADYILSEKNQNDAWFFEFINKKNLNEINIGSNENFSGIFFWVNALIGTPDEPLGVAGVGIPVDSVIEDFTKHGFGKFAKIWMVNNKGNIQIDEQKDNIGNQIQDIIPGSIVADFVAGSEKQSIQSYDDPNKLKTHLNWRQEVIVAMSKIPGTDSNIVICIYQTQWIWDIMKPFFKGVLFSGVIILIIVALIFAIISKVTTKILTRLSNAILDLGEANFDSTLCISDTKRKDEFGDIARGFETTREKLSNAYHTLQIREEEYRTLVENINTGVYRSTGMFDGAFIKTNSAIASIFGYDSTDEFMEIPFQQLFVDSRQRDEFLAEIKQKGECKDFEVKLQRKNGERFYGAVSATVQYDEKGSIKWVDGVIEDSTERKEKEKAQREREIAQAINEEIMDSIRYARMIQQSLLPSMEVFTSHIPDSFVIWKPRDIVGGDIFFADFFDDGIVGAVVDCTGHGVPGAFMSMIASSGLRRITRDEGCHDPAEILKRLNYYVKATLQQDTEHAVSDDGMDVALCFLNTQDKTFTFAGAKQPLFYLNKDELVTIKGDRQSIGYKGSDVSYSFTNHVIKIEKGMVFFMSTDGFTDQLGGDKTRMFGKKRFRNMLKEIASKPFDRQRDILIQAFETHKGDHDRQDDVTVVGCGFDQLLAED